MLRIAVIALFVANLLLLGFQCSKPPAQPETTFKKTVVEDSGIPTIHLFNELMQDQDLMSGNRLCFSLGPFHSSKDRNEVRTSLLEVSASMTERETQALVEKGYWVFLPPYASLLEANQVLLSLQALGLNDIGVIYDGDLKNAISLGYFLRQENALERKNGLEDRGYAPLIRVQREAEPRYWLDYEQNPGSGLITLDMQNRPNDFMQRTMPCPESDPFEIISSASENLAEKTVQPPALVPEEEPQLVTEESSEPPAEQSSEPPPGEGSEPPSGEGGKPPSGEGSEPPPGEGSEPPEEISSEPPPEENDESRQTDVNSSQTTETIDIDPGESIDAAPSDNNEAVPAQANETGPGNVLEVDSQNTNDIELQNGNEADPEVSANLTDDSLQQPTEIPEGDDGTKPTENEPQSGSETEVEVLGIPVDDTVQQQADPPGESDGSQTIVEAVVDPDEGIGGVPDDGVEPVPVQDSETGSENSIGTGPVIGYGVESEDDNETGSEDGNEAESVDGNEVESVNGDETETDAG